MLADASGRGYSGFVVALINGGGSSTEMTTASPMESLAVISRLSNAIYNVSNSMQSLKADLGRCAGLVKSFFNDDPALAERHRPSLNESIFALKTCATTIDAAIQTAADELISLRSETAIVAKRIARM